MDLNMLTIMFLFSFITPTKIMAYSHPQKGFSLELIHRDSIHSPLYPGNLTTQRSKYHIEPQDVNIRPRVVPDNKYLYIVRLAIGGPPTNLHLVLDTGSGLVWTQCEPCISCFEQDGAKFKPAGSGSFRRIPCSHPLCKPPFQCRRNLCVYDQRYMDNSFTQGVLGTDGFTFTSRTGQPETIPDIVFGCSPASSPHMFQSTKVGGIMGMDFKEESFIMQLANRINGSSRFSYCFPRDLNTISYLRFGGDVVHRNNLQRTPILKHNNQFYHILEDISVDGERMRFPSGTFGIHRDGSGGCMADTGAAVSQMIRQPYDRVKTAFMEYFEHFNLRIVSGSDIGLDLCYQRPRNFRHFPSMQYHFRGANLFVGGEKMFLILRGKFCLTLLPMDGRSRTIIGAAHQQDVQFVYDLREKLAYIGPANCAQV